MKQLIISIFGIFGVRENDGGLFTNGMNLIILNSPNDDNEKFN